MDKGRCRFDLTEISYYYCIHKTELIAIVLIELPHSCITLLDSLLVNRYDNNKHQTSLLARKRAMFHTRLPVRIRTSRPSLTKRGIVEVALRKVDLLDVVMHKGV